MNTEYYKWYSPNLGRDMELKVYGHGGYPFLFVPCQDGRFFDFENFNMTDTWSPWLESGKASVFSIDTMDTETWSFKAGDPYHRVRRHEAWMHYIVDEVVPFIRDWTRNHCGGWDPLPGVFGCSLGATHAVNLYYRFPDHFGRLMALSGIYSADYGFDGYWDEHVYNNSPVDYLAGMTEGHPYIEMYNRGRAVICAGQGPWEIPETTIRLRDIFAAKGINTWVDLWGHDVCHDWPWWHKQVAYFLPKLLED